MKILNLPFSAFISAATFAVTAYGQDQHYDNRPNILFIMSDDAASNAISCYKSRLSSVFQTPNIDRIANEGVLLNNCFVTNSICVPSRASILTGQYSHKNGVYTLDDKLDTTHETVAKILQRSGYTTAMIGKWHLVTEPQGFDYYFAMKGQGRYFDPLFNIKGQLDGNTFEKSKGTVFKGRHITSVIGDETLKWLDVRNKSKPFFLMCHFKAPHRPWQPDKKYQDMFKDVRIPEPTNLYDKYESRGKYTHLLKMKLEDMDSVDLKQKFPVNLSRDEHRKWAYQLYMKDYLRCMAGVDENVGRILDYLDTHGLTENTIVIYTSDQGFFLGEHGWFDKRLMQEESLKMPFVMRYPKEIKPPTTNNDMTLNIDFAPSFLDYAGLPIPTFMQGRSFRANLQGKTPTDWRTSMYYRYWMNMEIFHHTPAHLGIRTKDYKLIFYYDDPLGKTGSFGSTLVPEWELYDLKKDPLEMKNVYRNPKYKTVVNQMKTELLKKKDEAEDNEDEDNPTMKKIMNKFF